MWVTTVGRIAYEHSFRGLVAINCLWEFEGSDMVQLSGDSVDRSMIFVGYSTYSTYSEYYESLFVFRFFVLESCFVCFWTSLIPWWLSDTSPTFSAEPSIDDPRHVCQPGQSWADEHNMSLHTAAQSGSLVNHPNNIWSYSTSERTYRTITDYTYLHPSAQHNQIEPLKPLPNQLTDFSSTTLYK